MSRRGPSSLAAMALLAACDRAPPIPAPAPVAVALSSSVASVDAPPTRSPEVLPERPAYVETAAARALLDGALGEVRATDQDPYVHATIAGVPVLLALATRDGPQRWRIPVAAYRLSRLLAADVVPVTVARAFPLTELFAAADLPSRSRLRETLSVRPDGRVPAAVVMAPPATTTREAVFSNERARWERLAEADAVSGESAAVESFVAMLVLDYVAGNLFRRNVEEDSTGEIWLVDNRGMFAEHPEALGVDRIFEKLKRVARFPPRLREGLARLDEEALVAVMEAGSYESWLVQRRPIREMVVRARAARSVAEAGKRP